MHPRRPSIAFSVVHCALSVLALGLLARLLDRPLVLPAIGASAYVVFSAPTSPAAAPPSVLVAPLVGALVGAAILALFGIAGERGGLPSAPDWPRIGAVAGSLAGTIGVLRALRCSHAPAGATTVIVSVGLLPHARHALDFLLAAAVLVVHAQIACRAAGIAYPRWSGGPSD